MEWNGLAIPSNFTGVQKDLLTDLLISKFLLHSWEKKQIGKSQVKQIRAFITHDTQCQGLPGPIENKHHYPLYNEVLRVIYSTERWRNELAHSADIFSEVLNDQIMIKNCFKYIHFRKLLPSLCAWTAREIKVSKEQNAVLSCAAMDVCDALTFTRYIHAMLFELGENDQIRFSISLAKFSSRGFASRNDIFLPSIAVDISLHEHSPCRNKK